MILKALALFLAINVTKIDLFVGINNSIVNSKLLMVLSVGVIVPLQFFIMAHLSWGCSWSLVQVLEDRRCMHIISHHVVTLTEKGGRGRTREGKKERAILFLQRKRAEGALERVKRGAPTSYPFLAWRVLPHDHESRNRPELARDGDGIPPTTPYPPPRLPVQ